MSAQWLTYFFTHIDCYGIESARDVLRGALARWPDEAGEITSACITAMTARGLARRLSIIEDALAGMAKGAAA